METEEALKFNHTSFKTAISSLIEEVKAAEATLKKDGPEMLKEVRFCNFFFAQIK